MAKEVVDTIDIKDAEIKSDDADKEEKMEEKKKFDLKAFGKKALKVGGVILVGGAAFLGAFTGSKKGGYTELKSPNPDPAPEADPAPDTEWKEF